MNVRRIAQVAVATCVLLAGAASTASAEIVFMTHQAHEASVQKALDEIRHLDVVDQIGSVIRVED